MDDDTRYVVKLLPKPASAASARPRSLLRRTLILSRNSNNFVTHLEGASLRPTTAHEGGTAVRNEARSGWKNGVVRHRPAI